MTTTQYIAYLQSEIGLLEIGASEQGITYLTLARNEKKAEKHNEHIELCIKELEAYFNGTGKKFTVPLDFLDASDFYKSVWGELLKIPYGRTTSYQQIANDLSNPNAVRAVGMANGKNPVAIVVPCHRVVGSDGSLTGYALGVEMKEKLLMHENPKKWGIQTSLPF